jgi:hypothetical protein
VETVLRFHLHGRSETTELRGVSFGSISETIPSKNELSFLENDIVGWNLLD